ncbi:MAG: hypothetical protein E7618_02695 [Ruminococcaceae bacterium]|nr:hypothetical protein [Oscillospiraceae bacterium]
MKRIGVALLCILIAIFGFFSAFGLWSPIESVVGTISFWQIAAGLTLLVIGIGAAIRGRVFSTVMLFAFLFMVCEHNVAYLLGREEANLINNWLLLLLSALLGLGLSLLIPKQKRRIDTFPKHIANGRSFGSGAVYIDCANFREQVVENDLGSVVVKFENAAAYEGEGVLRVENNLGSVMIYVPAGWRTVCRIENSLGSVKNEASVRGDGPLLTILGENNLGAVMIKQA